MDDAGPTRNIEFDIDPLQKLPVNEFIDEIAKKCGQQAVQAYELVAANKEVCFIEDEQKRGEGIQELLKSQDIQV